MFEVGDLSIVSNSVSKAGVLKKWRDREEKYYIKSSRKLEDSEDYHIESIMECIAYEIGRLLGINTIPYWLDTLRDENGDILTVCVSEDYTKKVPDYVNRVSAMNSVRRAGLKGYDKSWAERYRLLISMYPTQKEDIDKMVIFDYLIDNYDRHLYNFEFYRNSQKVSFISPIFDNGSSLLSDYITDEDLEFLKEDETEFEDKIEYANTQSKCFAHEHSAEMHIIDRSVIKTLNMDITTKEFKEIVYRYSDYLSPLRIEMILLLLETRYQKLKRLCNTKHTNKV